MTTQETYLGEGSVCALVNVIMKISPRKLLVVRGKKSYSLCGAQEIIQNLVSKLKLSIVEFNDFTENPKKEDVQKGLQLLYREKPDIIIGIGGGSVIDMSKLLRFYYSNPNEFGTSFFEKVGVLVPLIAIPTTAGTGSEVTHFAVMYENRIKYSVANQNILPDIAIVDPIFTYYNSEYLTACTGFDALAQAIESYWNVATTNESEDYALKAIRLIWESLPMVIKDKNNVEARQRISEGAFWAGKAINITKTTGPHAISYSFTSHYNLPHGHAVAYTFPFFFDKNTSLEWLPAYQERMRVLLNLLGVVPGEDKKQFFIDYLNKISLSLKIPENFEVSVILSNINEERLKNNPGIEDISLLKENLQEYFCWLDN